MSSEIVIRASALKPIECVRDAFEAIKPHYPIFIGMVVAQFFIALLASYIPFIGPVLGNVVGACLICGMMMAYFSVFAGRTPTFTLLFEGFSRFVPVVIFMLIQTIPFVIVMSIIIWNGMLPETLTTALDAGQNLTPEQLQEVIGQVGAPVYGIYAAGWLAAMVFKAFLFFAVTVVADRDLGAGEAIAVSVRAFRANAFGVIGLLLTQIGLFIAGFLACGIGLALTAPLIYGAEAMAYRKVFGISEAEEEIVEEDDPE